MRQKGTETIWTDKSNYTRIDQVEDKASDLDEPIQIEIVENKENNTAIVTSTLLKRLNSDETKEAPSHRRLPSLDNLLWKSAGTRSVFNQKNNEYMDRFMDFEQLRFLLDDVTQNKPDSTTQFLECLDAQWNEYQSFAESEAIRINQYPAQKYVMVNILKYNQFIVINQRMLGVIIREYDSISLHATLASIWEWKLNWNPQKMLFALVKKISNLYDEQRGSAKDIPNQQIDEYSFDRESTKYFVKHSKILQVIGVIIQHLPIYVFGQDKKSPRVSGHISSVYFDTDDFKCYRERVGKEEGAKVFRIRWYDTVEPSNKSSIIWMERKIHHITSLGNGPSMKERFKLKSGKVRGFLNGSLKIPNDSKDSKLQNEIYEFVKQYEFTPKTRTVCDRMSFQLSYSNDLRISLDLNLKFFQEKNDLFQQENMWFTPLDEMSADEISEFPFDVLEIKLAGKYAENPPQWMQDLMDSALLIECYKFSKYGQSVNEFYQDKIELIPAWIENINILNKDYTQKVTQKNTNESVKVSIYEATDDKKASDESESDVKSKLYKYWKCVCACNKSERKRKAKPVNPKVHFSNERTFLQWFKAAIFIGSSGISIHALVPNDASGYIMVLCALIILMWGLVVYYVRNWKLLTGQMEGLHDFWGPGFLSFILIFVFLYALFDPDIAAGINP